MLALLLSLLVPVCTVVTIGFAHPRFLTATYGPGPGLVIAPAGALVCILLAVAAVVLIKRRHPRRAVQLLSGFFLFLAAFFFLTELSSLILPSFVSVVYFFAFDLLALSGLAIMLRLPENQTLRTACIAVTVALYLFTGLAGPRSFAHSLDQRIQASNQAAKAQYDHDTWFNPATGSFVHPAYVAGAGTSYSVKWCYPVFPGILLVNYVWQQPREVSFPRTKFVLYYGFGTLELFPLN